MTDRLEDKHTTSWPTVRRLFTIEQAADVSEKPVQEICRRVRIGRLKVYHLGGGRIRIDEAELADLISSRDSEPRQPQGRTDGSGPWFASAETSRS